MTDTIKRKDYENEAGKVDWKAYDAAQTANGEQCVECGRGLFPRKPVGAPAKCYECDELQESGEVSHSRYLRCPQCGEVWNPSDSEDYEVYGEDCHDVCCQSCEYVFEVSTHVSHTFTSPPRLSDEEQAAWKKKQEEKEAEWQARQAAWKAKWQVRREQQKGAIDALDSTRSGPPLVCAGDNAAD